MTRRIDGGDAGAATPVLARLDSRSTSPAEGEVLCAAVVRDENLRLPYFLEYHRTLGVERFLIVDNGSTDGSLEFLLEQPDVIVYETEQDYAAAAYGTRWIHEVLTAHAVGHWALVLDADELLVYPDCETTPLRDLTAGFDRAGAQTMRAFLLDMYSERAIADTDYERTRPFIEAAPLFEADSYHERDAVGLPQRGGPRHRLFWRSRADSTDSPWLTKFPLIRWRKDLTFDSVHNPPDATVAGTTGALLHFKLLSDFYERARSEAGRKQHFQSALEYQAYWRVLDGAPDLSAVSSGSIRYEDSTQLVQLGLLKTAADPGTHAEQVHGAPVTSLPDAVERLLEAPPALHGAPERLWLGGCEDLVRPMLHLISAEVGRNDLRVIETGAGLSTLALLSMGWQVTSVSPDQALGPRIETYAERTAIGREGWEHIVRRSELALPLLMDRSYDVALMDGGRGWPTVFVDFCYLNAILRKGGLLLIDDAQLHSVRELVELLRAQPGYRLVRDRTKLRAFAKETDERYLPGLDGEPYLQPNPG